MVKKRCQLGNWGEELAIRYLLGQGYQIITRQWQRREGEIDIIAFDPKAQFLVFVEVKTRSSKIFGEAVLAINTYKQRKLKDIISCYLLESGYRGNYRCDVILIYRSHKIVLEHLKNVVLE